MCDANGGAANLGLGLLAVPLMSAFHLCKDQAGLDTWQLWVKNDTSSRLFKNLDTWTKNKEWTFSIGHAKAEWIIIFADKKN